MNKFAKEITKADLISFEEYSKNRKTLRKEIVNYKRNRRVSLGPYANFYFESYKTMKAQIQEMLYIEKGGDEQLKDELAAYNPLVPNGKELVATLMFEIDNPLIRTEFLNKIGGIENKIFFKVGNQKIQSIPENDVDRTSAEGKASSVQFVHFKFTDDQIASFKNLENEVLIGIDHNVYNHTVTLSSEVKKNLLEDFN
ncbi:MAG: hypothetical protein CBC24_06305 [Candidatus Pelagibacter sp. TMED64]|nr:hypothetical protein [Candidatus Pelagibacter sp.]OUU65066.1 MAG: hypothetical protein CBC24_06305 [Candidatus Pelagibacter sp. TMED64]